MKIYPRLLVVTSTVLPLACCMFMSAAYAQAPPMAAGVKTFKISGFDAFSLQDGRFQEPNDGRSFVLGQTTTEVKRVLERAGLPGDHIGFEIHPLLVRAHDRVLLFDTGAGRYFGPSAGNLLRSMALSGTNPSSVTDIFISHGHGDHVGGLIDASGKLVFPNAIIHMSRPEWRWLSEMKKADGVRISISDVKSLVAAIRPKVATFSPGAVLIPGMVTAIEIDGHTPGHSGYEIGSGNATVLYAGDVMHNDVVSVQKPAWKIAFDQDKDRAEASRVAFEEAAAKKGQRLFLVHFPSPGFGRIVQGREGYTWVAEPLP